ncbi:MAG: DUF4446 family protein, partial [Lachnospiraceae bacterium]|nr:DUF4446 family protein [Lachnospiraceae bacterium]
MEKTILTSIGIDPFFVFILMFILIIAAFLMIINLNMKYNRLKSKYNSFTRGKDGRTLESSILDKFSEIDEIVEMTKQNRQDIRNINRKMAEDYQKVGIVKYDAFHEMGGKLSFALTMLDGDNNGWIINAMHSREGCYTYIKEIVK